MLKKILPIFIVVTPMIAYAQNNIPSEIHIKTTQSEASFANAKNKDSIWFESNVSGQDVPITLIMALRALSPSNIQLVSGRGVDFSATVTWEEGTTLDALDQIMYMAGTHFSLPGNGTLVVEAGLAKEYQQPIVKPAEVLSVIKKVNSTKVIDASKAAATILAKNPQVVIKSIPVVADLKVADKDSVKPGETGLIPFFKDIPLLNGAPAQVKSIHPDVVKEIIQVNNTHIPAIPAPVAVNSIAPDSNVVKPDATLINKSGNNSAANVVVSKLIEAPIPAAIKPEWRITKGEKLSEAMIKWGVVADVGLVFGATDYIVGADIHVTGSFDEALRQLLEGANMEVGVSIKAMDYNSGSRRMIRIVDAS